MDRPDVRRKRVAFVRWVRRIDPRRLVVLDCRFLSLRQTRLIVSSYRHWTGKTLWPADKPDAELAKEVFFAPFVLASAGTEEDPVLNYGNQNALKLWEMDWETFTRTPGRETAEPMERTERARFLETVQRQG